MKKSYFKKLVLAGAVLGFTVHTQAQNKQEVQRLTGKYNQNKLQSITNSFKQKAAQEKAQAHQIAKLKGWKTKYTTKDGRMVELQRVENGKPIYYTTFNVAAARSTRTNHLNQGGSLGLNLMGQGMTAYVWDGGVANVAHQEYDGAGGNNRFSIGDGSSTLNFHAEHVTGTIMASGFVANAKGMAPQASAIGHDWNSDKAEATSAASNGMLVSNHSYGYAFRNSAGQVQLPQHYFGGYITESRDWDQIMFNAPNYLMVVAAGNDGNDNTANNNPTGGSGWDKLTGHSTSKNNLVVANAQDANIDANGNLVSVTINASSSEGPTDDMRIKPDITGNGTNVYSSFHFPSWDAATGLNESDGNVTNDYRSISGTSMASPNVTGSLLLLQQHYKNENSGSFMKASTLKGLALHTADDAGASGPDAVFGWGLLNAKKAAEAISNNGNESKVEELTLTSGQTYTITVDSDGTNPLLASISWTDRPGTANTTVNSTTPVLVNDLDIRVSKGGTTYLPYELTGPTTSAQRDNNVDPFERIDVANASGTYTITVTHKGNLTGGSQNFSLIVTGLTGTPVVCNATVPTGVTVNGVSDTSATISWDAVSGASYDVRYRAAGTTSWTTVAVSGTSTSLSGLNATTQYEVQVRSKCTTENSAYSASSSFTTTEVQLNYCDSKGNNVSDEYIQRVQLGTIDNNNSGNGNGYSDHTSLSTNLTKGQSNTITITPKWTGTVYDEGYAVFIDYNKDGDFADSGETVWTKAKSKDTPVSGSFTVPASATNGATRMRVIMQYNTTPASSCGSYNYGETEDYTVVIGAGAADTTAPVITLNGSSTVTVEVGGTYTEQGATATDNVDGNLTASITTTGTVDTNTVGTYTVNYNVSDAAGNAATQVSRTVNVVDTTAPVITLNGNATISLTVGDSFTDPGATASDNYDGNISANITVTGSVNTSAQGTYTLNYNVSDAAGNAATQVSRTVNVNAATGGSGCTNGVSSFPYAQGYENTLGDWTQSTDDDINWTVDSAGTPSSNTGPSSASEGTYYVYVEASGNGTGYPNKRAILNSPCYDLSGESAASFSFKYHMYGASDMGSIALEASSDNGATWTSVWSETGNKGNSWQTATVDLASYVGSSVQLRFNRVTGSTWQADIALDDVKLTTGSAPVGDTTVTLSITFDNYPEETSWEIQNGSGSVVASGGTYASQADGSTLNINVDLPAGCYNLIMKDSYGDGMCCSYGNGSYTLTSGGTTLASGASFQSTDTKNFCVGGATNSTSYYTTFAASPQIETPSISLKVYPNPTRSFLNVSILGANADRYEVINTIGQTVLSGSYQKTIDVSSLTNGIYLLRLQTGEKSKMTKFVKQ